MLSGYASQPVALYINGEYLCLKCAGAKLGELHAAKIIAGLAPLPGDPGEWDANGLVWRWEVIEKLNEIEAVKNEGRRAHKRIDWDEINGLEWGTRCSECGNELAPDTKHKPDLTTTGMCRFCWEDEDSPVHETAT